MTPAGIEPATFRSCRRMKLNFLTYEASCDLISRLVRGLILHVSIFYCSHVRYSVRGQSSKFERLISSGNTQVLFRVNCLTHGNDKARGFQAGGVTVVLYSKQYVKTIILQNSTYLNIYKNTLHLTI